MKYGSNMLMKPHNNDYLLAYYTDVSMQPVGLVYICLPDFALK